MKEWVHSVTYNDQKWKKSYFKERKDGFTPSPTITTMVRKASVLKKNQSFANIVTNLNSHNGYEKSINLNPDQSKLRG